MEAYGQALNFIIPIFFALYFIELIVARKRERQVIRSMDSISSFSSGITNVVKDVVRNTEIRAGSLADRPR
jgi:alkylglycerol monooxygenase